VAPVTAVWGNTDGFDVRNRLPEVARRQFEGHTVVVLHGHQLGRPTPKALAEAYADASLVVFGHTHAPGHRTGKGCPHRESGMLRLPVEGVPTLHRPPHAYAGTAGTRADSARFPLRESGGTRVSSAFDFV
jgi:predicted phosphodiesterase